MCSFERMKVRTTLDLSFMLLGLLPRIIDGDTVLIDLS
jgi:hypothetical protein